MTNSSSDIVRILKNLAAGGGGILALLSLLSAQAHTCCHSLPRLCSLLSIPHRILASMAGHFVLDADDRHAIKDCILRSLQKLNDRDTQKTGIEELHEIFEVPPPVLYSPAPCGFRGVVVPHTTRAKCCHPISERIASTNRSMLMQKYMDSEMVSFIVPVICSPGEAAKPWARRECLRLLGALTSRTCIEAELMFSNQAILSRVCTCVTSDLRPLSLCGFAQHVCTEPCAS